MKIKIFSGIILSALILITAPISLYAGETGMLDNGIKFIEKPRPYTNTVTAAIFIKGGLFGETPATNGLGALTAQLWVKSNKILETAEFYGGVINAKLAPYAFEILFSAPTDKAEKLIGDFETFLLKPKFDEKVFEREKALLIEELRTAKDNPNAVAYERFNEEVFKGSPYAMPTQGKIESVKNLTLEDVESYYRSSMQGARIVVAIAGNYDKKFASSLKKALSSIDKGKVLEYDCDGSQMTRNARIEDKDTRIKQAKMFIGYNAPAVSSPQYPAVKVLTTLLGDGMSSRYFSEIRKNSGYAYSVGAAYPSRVCSSRFFASVGLDYANVDAAVKKIDEINTTLSKTITDEEINKAKNSILGSVLMETQSNSSKAWNAAFFETMGLGADYYDKYVDTLKNVTKKDLLEAAELFKGPKLVYVLKPAGD